MPRSGIASDRQLALPLGNHGDESTSGTGREDAPVVQDNLLERVLEVDNLRRALRQVRRNSGAPGIDGMTVEELAEHLKEHWPRQKESLLNGAYKPQPVRRVTSAWSPDGPRPVRPASPDAGITGGMGRWVLAVELRFSPQPVGASSRRQGAGVYPARIRLRGRH